MSQRKAHTFSLKLTRFIHTPVNTNNEHFSMSRVTYSHISSITLRAREETANFIWSAICFKIMTRYTCGFFPRILAIIPATRYSAFFCHVYLRSFLLCGVFIPKFMTIFLQTRMYVPTKKSIYMRYKQPCGRIRGTESYRQKNPLHVQWSWKVTSVWIKHGRNGRVNFEQDLVLIHCPHSSGGCWLPDNGFVGIRGLSLERLCTLFHKCWPKQRSIQLEISIRQAKHDSQPRDN